MPTPTREMATEAQQGLDWREEYGRGGTEVGVARARDISNRRNLSMETVLRMKSYFARHEVDKEAEGFYQGQDGFPSAGRIAWQLWGGDAGEAWANRIVEQEAERSETRPYVGEHAARLHDPDKYDSFSRENDAGGSGVDFIWGILPDGGVEIQAIRFDADMFTVDAAKEWLQEHDFEAILFEPAVDMDEMRDGVILSPQTETVDMSQKEIRALHKSVEIREEDSGEIRVSGYAAVFGEETNIGGMFTEEIRQGAFKDAVGRDDVVFLINHEGLPLARTRSGTLTLREDDHGLYMEASLDPSDPDVRSIVPKMKRGDLDKMSFAFIPTRQSWDDKSKTPKRMIEEAQLFDVSIVTTPAYEGTEIGLRSFEQFKAEQGKITEQTRNRLKRKLRKL